MKSGKSRKELKYKKRKTNFILGLWDSNVAEVILGSIKMFRSKHKLRKIKRGYIKELKDTTRKGNVTATEVEVKIGKGMLSTLR